MTQHNERSVARSNIVELTRLGNELIARIDSGTSDEERMRKPSPDAWSLAEVVQHLSLVAAGMLRTARPSGGTASIAGGAKSALLRGVLRSGLKMRAPVPGIVPRPGVAWSDARNNLAGSNDQWIAFVDGATFDEMSFMHPFVGKLTPAETAAFLVEHFRHHARQVERLFAGFGVRAL